jgi:NADH-quinone oxidoreductase chain I
VKKYFGDLATGAQSLVAGFIVTLRALLSPVVTVQYPREKCPVGKGYRGHPHLILEDETGRPKCIACGSCMRMCPSRCFTVQGEKKEGDKRKYPTVFQLDFTRCSLCGTCSEVCPVAAIEYSDEYGLAGFTREEFHYDLLADVPCRAETGVKPVATDSQQKSDGV